jgi:hypothetical protein
MNPRIPLAFALCLLACRPQGTGSFGHTLERGGTLADVRVEDMTVRITESTVSAWGLLEVPDGSRLQAAYAGVDAIARAELLKLVRVRVAGLMVSVDSSDPARRDAYERIVEAVAGSLRRAGSTQHGWARVKQAERIVLRVWSQLTVPRADVEAALAASHAAGNPALPAGMDVALESLPPHP